MTILPALQSAMIRLVGYRPDSIYSSTNETEMQIGDIANEVAVDIMKSHGWQALTRVARITGDGVEDAFPLPADYDRMAVAAEVEDGLNWFWNYVRAYDMNEWIRLKNSNFNIVPPGWWIILENKLQFFPSPYDGAKADYAYISNEIAYNTEQNTGVIIKKKMFDQDSDTFVLNNRLITLGVIWKYREQKGMGYAEDLANYEIALSQEQARDKGGRVIRTPVWRRNPYTQLAYPWQLGS